VASSETIDRLSGFRSGRNQFGRRAEAKAHGLESTGRSWFWRRLFRRLWWNHRQLGCDLKAGLEYESGHGSGSEAGGIVLDTQRAGSAIEAETADAVNIFCAGQCEDRLLSGRSGVGIENFHCGHKAMIARRQGSMPSVELQILFGGLRAGS